MRFDDDHLRVLGLAPESASTIVAKSAIAWKAAFGDYARRALCLETPGYCPTRVEDLTFQQRPYPLHPLDRDPTWEADVTASL